MPLLEVMRDQSRCVPNVLIVGSESAAETALQELGFMFDGPADIRVLPGPLVPLPRADCVVLILRNVESLTRVQQMELSQWLDSRPGVPVVSVTSSSVFRLVGDGTFSAPLYYRLNMIVEDAVTGAGTASWLLNSSSVNR